MWFDKNAMTNVLSLANVVKNHHVEFDSNKDNAFIVHSTTCLTRFDKTMENLYVYKPKYMTGAIFLETVKDNKTFFTDRQVNRAKGARRLLHALGYPSVQDICNILKMNSIKNSPVMEEDLFLAEKIFGK